METKKFEKRTGKFKGGELVIPADTFLQTPMPDDCLTARVMRTFIDNCSYFPSTFYDAQRVLSNELQADLRLRVTLKHEEEGKIEEYIRTYNEVPLIGKNLYAVQVLPSKRDIESPGKVEMILNKRPADLSIESIAYLSEAWPRIERILGGALRYEAANLEKSRDPLTSLWNRRSLAPLLEHRVGWVKKKAIENGRRKEDGLSYPGFAAIIVDLDHFKKINDTYGHPKGDEVLKIVSHYLETAAKRETDDIVRLGGEEFLILLDCAFEDAKRNAEELRKSVESQKYSKEFGEFPCKVTASIGIAHTSEFMNHENLQRNIYELADKRVYHAKETGRNKVESEFVNKELLAYLVKKE